MAIAFFEPAFSPPKLLGLGYARAQATEARRDSKHTPTRPGEVITPALDVGSEEGN